MPEISGRTFEARQRQLAAADTARDHVAQLKPDRGALLDILCTTAPLAVLDAIHQLVREGGRDA